MPFTKEEILEQNRDDIEFFGTFSTEVQEALKLQLLAFQNRNEFFYSNENENESQPQTLMVAE